MQDDADITLPAEELRTFTHAVLTAAGVTEPHAKLVTDGLVRANLRGVDSHGVARLETYVKKFEAGGFNPDPDMTVDRTAPSTVLVDADDGPGQSAGKLAMDAAMEIASENGIGAGVVRNSNHFGTAAFYTQHASDDGFIGISMTNVGPDVVPYDGREAFLGTNPISVAVPTNRSFPITVDMATSTVAMGRIDHEAKENDESIPADWGVDADGEPTTDPNEVAALRPMGGPKGYGLGLVVDVLCGVLSGAGHSTTVGPLYDDYGDPMDLGHFVAAIDVSAFRDLDEFVAAIEDMITELKQVDTRTQDEVKLPGEIEAETRERRERDGVPLPAGVYESLRRLGREYDVPLHEETAQ